MKILKRIFFIVYLLFVGMNVSTVNAAQVVNVEYIHKLITQTWQIDVPYFLENAKMVANMEYLLKVVDRANEILNGRETSSYGTDAQYATKQVVDTVATIDAVNNLIVKQLNSVFFITTTSSTSSFSFKISAAGEYTIDWGDGNIDEITKTDTTTKTYSHTYARSGEYIIGLGGKATLYNSNTTTAAVSFNANKNIAKISGSLGEVFSTLANGGQPRFYQTFYNCTNIKSNIPENLFAGVTGQPVSNMFDNTFYGCSGFTGEIPENLFAGLNGSPQPFVFYRVFEGCSGLTGEIPGNLFAGIQGAPAQSMFYSAFAICSGLTKIPENLFAGIQGKPAQQMFQSTFWGCSGISEIPENLFAGVQGEPAYGMFQTTFHLSGIESIPANLFAGIYGRPATFMFNGTFSYCPKLKTIEGPLFSRINGAPADFMYQAIFENSTELSGEIPLGMFGTFTSNTAMTNMFVNAFYNCSKLTGPSARMPDGTYLYNYFNTASSAARDMYYNCTGLSDYSSIPTAWK